VMPVASDLDAFTIGSTSIEYPALPEEQLPFLHSLLKHIEFILATPDSDSWMHRWLHVLKQDLDSGHAPLQATDSGGKPRRRSYIAGSFGQKREDGRYGFGDKLNQEIIKGAVSSSVKHLHGAVRHAAESFNYYWPQELDDEYLVVWDGFLRDGVRWHYMSEPELRTFLLERAKDGYAFPLNPKWILCDKGWYDVYAALLSSPATTKAIDAWFPRYSGLQKKIAELHERYPDGFVRRGSVDPSVKVIDPSVAELNLNRYQALKRAKVKLRIALRWGRLGSTVRNFSHAAGARDRRNALASNMLALKAGSRLLKRTSLGRQLQGMLQGELPPTIE
jgi:hypothetical protein